MNLEPGINKIQAQTAFVRWLYLSCLLVFLSDISGSRSGFFIHGVSPDWIVYFQSFLRFLTGAAFMIAVVLFFKRIGVSAPGRSQLVVLFSLGAFQVLLGCHILIQLKESIAGNEHFHYGVHQMLSMATFGYAYWVSLGFASKPVFDPREFPFRWFRPLVLCLVILIFSQVFFGSLVAGLNAGRMYPTFPMMGGQWIPEEIRTGFLQEGWIIFFNDGAAVQLIHRWLGFLVFLFCTGIWFFSRRTGFPESLQMTTKVLMIIVVLHFFIGYQVILAPDPFILLMLHRAGNFLLLGAGLFFLHRLKSEQPAR